MTAKTIMVTGCAGFIGSHLCDKLLINGNSIIGIDNFDPFYPPSLKRKNIENLNDNSNFCFIEADVIDYDKMKLIFTNYNIDTVIHLAARAGVRTSVKIPFSYVEVNIKSTLVLLELCKEHRINTFIFGSSSSVYGDDTEIPFREDSSSIQPLSPYAASKKSAELFCYTYSHLYDIKCIILRFFTVYGPRQRPEMAISKFVKNIDNNIPILIYGSENSSRDYTYVDDIVGGIIKSQDCECKYEIFNLGNSNSVQLGDLIQIIEKNLEKKAIKQRQKKQIGDAKVTLADISKAKKYLNYNPKTSIEQGVKNYISWYRKTKKHDLILS